MRYMAQRAGTNEWIDRDLPFSEVERTRDLSGPGTITATIDPELRRDFHTDGLRILEGWTTLVYAVDDAGVIRNGGIYIDASFEDSAMKASIAGFSSYPHGYYFTISKTWGPDSGKGLDRPDPLQIVQDHWSWIQAQDDSDYGVRVVGDLSSSVRIGTNEEPYRLYSYEAPDLGNEIDSLAGSTPFDYVEEHGWLDDAKRTVDHRVRLGWPRLGRQRTDLRFEVGVNIIDTIPAATSGASFAQDIIGIGNGEGSKMVRSRATVRDGRRRRQRVVTDKTLSQAALDRLVLQIRESSTEVLDIAALTIGDHPEAPIAAINLGDDIFVKTHVRNYGDVEMWLRVISITENDVDDTVVLTTQRSSSFLYSPTVELSST